jgi:cell division protein FtsI (penicillin-binding protein 3)
MTTSAPRRSLTLEHQPRIKTSSFRLLLVGAILIMGELCLASRIIYLQVVEAPSLRQKALQQQLAAVRPFIARRPIVDRNNNVLAIDKVVYTLYAHPFLFKESKEVIAGQLAPILKRPSTELARLFNTANSGIQVKFTLSEDTADQIRKLRLDGIELIQRWQRVYPQQDLASGVTGFANFDHEGQAGLEHSQQKLIQPDVKPIKATRDGAGSLMPDRVPIDLLQADDLRLQLTLDGRLQRIAQDALEQKLKQYGAERGTVIVMNAQSGALLALVTRPSYNPNRYYEFDPALFKNWALSDLYEPGSTFKPINVAIALEAGAIQPDSVFNDEGQLAIGGWTVGNYDGSANGPLSITQILEKSSNIGMVHIVQQMKPAAYYDRLLQLGLGKVVDTDLPFETAGQFKSREQFTSAPIEPAVTAFGQGFSVTPIQMAQLHAAIANGGKLVTPHVVQGLFNQDGKAAWKPSPAKPQQVFSPTTARQVTSMMGKVVENGTGKPAQIPGYRLGGKTGTAQKAAGGTYVAGKITSFVGIFPLESPRYVVLAVADEPKGGDAFGSTVAAPVVKAVIEALITVEGIPPSHPSEVQSSALP